MLSALVILAGILVIVGVVALQPSAFSVTRSAVMAAAASEIFPQVNNFHHWHDWSPWARIDPEVKKSFEGPDSGTDAIFRWEGNKQVGIGNMTITESRANELIRIRLEFLKPFKGVSNVMFTFAAAEGGTRVTWSMSGKNGFMGKLMGMIMNCNKMIGGMYEKGLASLKAIVESGAPAVATPAPVAPIAPPAPEPFVISRRFDLPREYLFELWTRPEEMAKWWGPKGFNVGESKMDLRPGGTYHYCLLTPDGQEMWGKFVYREISAPQRLVWVNSFSDAQGGITRHPWSPGWPLEMLTTVTFAEEEGGTQLTIEWLPLNATGEERETFEQGRASMQQGWTGTLDQLSEFVAQEKS